jgi:hypothetical protein
MGGMFKLDLIALVDQGVRHDVSVDLDADDCVQIGCRHVLDELARQLHAAGAPDAPLEQQLTALFADHLAMRAAGEEMPSDVDAHRLVPTGSFVGMPERMSAIRAILSLFRPIIARLMQRGEKAEALVNTISAQAHDMANEMTKAMRERDEAREVMTKAVPVYESARDGFREALADNERLRARVAELEARLASVASISEDDVRGAGLGPGDAGIPGIVATIHRRAATEARPRPNAPATIGCCDECYNSHGDCAYHGSCVCHRRGK